MQNKDDKVGNKTINKEGKEGEKKRERKIEIDSQKKKNCPNFGFCACVKNNKAFFQVGRKTCLFVLAKLVFSHRCMLISQKPVKRRGIGEK